MKAAQFLSVISVVFFTSGIFVAAAYADEHVSSKSGASVSSKSGSSNFGKTSKFLPGEEVVTPTGKKVKVWSTKGPVRVSPAPQPFEDREKSVLHNSHIVIDSKLIRENRKSDQ